LGITNLVARSTAGAAELARDELRGGGESLILRLRRYRPAWLAVLGVGAFRTAFERRSAVVGPQPEPLAGVPTWVLPNPSGLNAHYQLDTLAAEFARLRSAAS
jgi:TDG/mug DNA glycosylase family protein